MKNILQSIFILLFTVGCTSAQKDFESAKSLIEKDLYADAIVLLEKAANKGHAEAQYILAECYINGNGTMINEDKCVEWMTKSANQGVVGAQIYLGDYYKWDNPEESIKWYNQAIENGDTCSYEDIAMCYRRTNNEEKAIEYYLKIIDQGTSDSDHSLISDVEYMIGDCYRCMNMYDKAIEYYEKAEKDGSLYGTQRLAQMYIEGEGVKQNVDLALELYVKLANEDGEFYSRCATAHYEAEKYTEAIKWYEKALNGWHTISNMRESDHSPYIYYHLGVCYYYGKGVQMNKEVGLKYLQKAANKDHADAKSMLYKIDNK